MQKNNIGISLGDPAGIGAEILIKAFSEITKLKNNIPVVIGDIAVINRNLKYLDVNPKLNILKNRDNAIEGVINIYNTNIIVNKDFPIGKDSKICGNASFLYVQQAVHLWKEGLLDAVVTLPISKKAWHLAGRHYSGHTEFLAEKLSAKKHAMLMLTDKIKVLLVTTHIPLKDVPVILTKQLIVEKVSIAHKFLLDAGIGSPVIAISAINPHSGEGGILGMEEEEVIIPAIDALKRLGIRCVGPVPADAVFKKAIEGKVSLIASMYHDQALIPLKTFYFNKLVNYTAGLDMIRTSPGHGTGFDIAYQNKADPSSFIEAYKMAVRLIKRRKKN